MADIKVGGAYVDLYLKGIDKFNKDSKDAQKELTQLNNTMSKLEKQQKAQSKVLADAESKFGKYSKEAKTARKELKDLESQYNDANRQTKILTKSLQEQATAMNKLSKATLQQVKANNIAEQIKGMSDSAILAKNNFNELKIAMDAFRTALVALGAKSLYDFLIEPNAQFEQYIVQFTTLLGSIENAQTIMNDIIQVAKKTPFETPDVADAVEILSQYGVAQDELMDKFNQLADLSKGNAENLNAIALSYGRITNSSKVTLQQLNIMIRRGVPIMQAFADVTGKTSGELYKMIRNGELGIDVFKEAIDYLTKNGGKFEGLVEEQSKTLEGRISTLKDDITFIGKDIGEATFEQLSGYIKDIISELDKLEATGELKEITDGLGGAIADLVEMLANLAKWLYDNGEVILPIIQYFLTFKVALLGVQTALKALAAFSFATFFNPLNAVLTVTATAVTTLIYGFVNLKAKEEELAGTTRDIKESFEKSIDTYNNAISIADAYSKKSKELTGELESLMSQEQRTSKERERVAEIIQELNRIYPELNAKYSEERDELNLNIKTLNDYIAAQERASRERATSNLIDELEEQRLKAEVELELLIKKRNDALSLYFETIQNYKLSDKIADFFGLAEGADLWEEVVILSQAMEENQKIIDASTSSLSLLREEQSKLFDEMERAENIDVEYLPYYGDVVDDIEELGKIINMYFEELETSSSGLASSIKSTINAVDDLTDAMAKNSSETGFNLDEVLNLMQTYPELADAIYAITDGYKFEESALETLRQKKIQASLDAINAKYDEVNSFYLATQSEILILEAEGKAVDELIAKLKDLSTQMTVLDEDRRRWEKMLQIAQSDVGRTSTKKASTSSSSSASKSASSKATETADAKAIRNLKFQYDMGIIDAQNYYDSLEKIKNKYYKNGTKEWQQYTLEIKRGREKIQEEQKKAAESEFKNTISGMEELIDDAEFYGTASKEEIVKKYQEIRTYILNAYLDRRIDYENFAEQIRKIDKSIYTAQKDMLKENLDEMSLLRSDSYDKAVKQINDYYDSIKKARKNAEREEELAELKETEALYQGAVSRQGQQKLKELQKDIRKLEVEKMQEELENQREYHLENLDAKYKALEESQNEYFSTIQSGVKTTAEIVAEYTKQINDFFAQVNQVMQTQRAINEPIVNSLTLNQTINDASSNRAAIDISKIVYNYGFK